MFFDKYKRVNFVPNRVRDVNCYIMSLPENYIDRDVVKHFASLINDVEAEPFTILMSGADLWDIVNKFGLKDWLPDWISLKSETDFGLLRVDKGFVDRMIDFSKSEKAILTIKEQYLSLPGSQSNLKGQMESGADIRIVDDILGAMVVASKKRRNKVLFAITGYEDEALVTAAGLAKAKTVGFRNFFVFQQHFQTPGIINTFASNNNIDGFMIPLKVGLNTGPGAYSSISLTYNKGVVISGYEPAEIMQSVWMLISQKLDKKPATVFQRTKEVSDEVINRSRWMIEEVFEPADLLFNDGAIVNAGAFKIREKYSAFDANLL